MPDCQVECWFEGNDIQVFVVNNTTVFKAIKYTCVWEHEDGSTFTESATLPAAAMGIGQGVRQTLPKKPVRVKSKSATC